MAAVNHRDDVGAACDGVRVIVDFESPLWVWDARKSETWTFVSVPEDISEEIRDLAAAAGPRRGFGSVRVRASIGGSTWSTSIFPGADGYVLPVKRAIRKAESLDIGDTTGVTVELKDF